MAYVYLKYVIQPGTYRHGKQSFVVGRDGGIKVKHGDCLSAYAAATLGNPMRANEFGRMQGARLQHIANLNLILAGETVYHMPTYNAAHHHATGIPFDKLPIPISDKSGEEVSLLYLKSVLGLGPEDIPLLEAVSKAHSSLDVAHEVAETVNNMSQHPEALEGALENMGAVLSFAGFFLTICEGLKNISDAHLPYAKPIKGAAMAYATVNWMFWGPYKDPPEPPAKMLQRILTIPGNDHAIANAQQYNQAVSKLWDEAWRQTTESLRDIPLTRKAALQKAFGGNAGAAYDKIIDGFDEETDEVFFGLVGKAHVLTGSERKVLESYRDDKLLSQSPGTLRAN